MEASDSITTEPLAGRQRPNHGELARRLIDQCLLEEEDKLAELHKIVEQNGMEELEADAEYRAAHLETLERLGFLIGGLNCGAKSP